VGRSLPFSWTPIQLPAAHSHVSNVLHERTVAGRVSLSRCKARKAGPPPQKGGRGRREGEREGGGTPSSPAYPLSSASSLHLVHHPCQTFLYSSVVFRFPMTTGTGGWRDRVGVGACACACGWRWIRTRVVRRCKALIVSPSVPRSRPQLHPQQPWHTLTAHPHTRADFDD
jgi:hypothetical protein